VGEVAELTEAALVAILGPGRGRHLHALAHNRDPRPVQVGKRRKSMGAQCALGRRPKATDAVDATLVTLVDRVTRRMRDAARVGRTVELRLRFNDFTSVSRSRTMPEANAHTRTILSAARALLAAEQPRVDRDGITLIGVAVSNLSDERAVQLTLAFDRGCDDALDSALDAVRAKFGANAMGRVVLLGQDQGWSMPMLPD
jgi:DNA polymerase-4